LGRRTGVFSPRYCLSPSNLQLQPIRLSPFVFHTLPHDSLADICLIPQWLARAPACRAPLPPSPSRCSEAIDACHHVRRRPFAHRREAGLRLRRHMAFQFPLRPFVQEPLLHLLSPPPCIALISSPLLAADLCPNQQWRSLHSPHPPR
jgi:hypothetical protein